MYTTEIYSKPTASEPGNRYQEKRKCKPEGKRNTVEKTFVDLKSYFGFKKVFGSKNGKTDLIRLMNSLIIDSDRKIIDLVFRDINILGANGERKEMLYDISFIDSQGRSFLIKMQNYFLENLPSRMIYTVASACMATARKGVGEHFFCKPFFGVVISSFAVSASEEYLSHFSLCDIETLEEASDLMKHIVVELDKFTKSVDELETEQDVFLFLLNNLETLSELPPTMDPDLYGPLFERARIANFTNKEKALYDLAVLTEERHLADIKSAQNRGKKEGKTQATETFVKKLLQSGCFSLETIAELMELTPEEVCGISELVS